MIWTPPKFNKNDVNNFLTESFLYRRFKLLMLNQFKWSGLEEHNIQERHVEEYLFNNGVCLFFEDKTDGKLCLPCYGQGMNVYGDPLRYIATGHCYEKEVDAEDAVLIENNKLHLPTTEAVYYFVGQLFDLKRTMDINVKQLRMPVVFTATDKNVLTVKKIQDEIDNNNWCVVTDSSIQAEDIVKAIQTGVKPLTKELTDRYNAVMNEALTYFGFNNANTDKRERLLTDEVNSNNQLIDCCAQMFLEARQRACDEINKKFGTNISVELRNKPVQEGNENVIQSIEKTDSE